MPGSLVSYRFLFYDIYILAGGRKVELLSGEFFQCILIVLEHIQSGLHLLILLLIILDQLFLPADFNSSLDPMTYCIAWPYSPNKKKYSGHDCREPEKLASGACISLIDLGPYS